MPTTVPSHLSLLVTLGAGLVSLAAAGCVGLGQPRYQVQRSARVLPPLPSMRSGAPMADPIELSSNTGVVTVAEANDNDSGNRVSRTWVDGALRLRISGHGDLALLGEAAPASPSIRVSESDMPPVGTGMPYAFGAGLRTRIGEDRGMNVGLNLDILRHSVPVAQVAECVSGGGLFDAPCPAGSDSPTHWSGRSSTGMLRMGLVPTWVGERFTWFGGVSIRTAHWVPREDEVRGAPDSVELEIGWSAVVAAGAEFPLGERVRLQALVAQPVGDPGAGFGPLVSLGLTVAVAPARAASRPAPAPRPEAPRPPASGELTDLRRACLPHTSAYWRQYDAGGRTEILAAMPPACRALVELRRPAPGR